jgi:hypothetical protein
VTVRESTVAENSCARTAAIRTLCEKYEASTPKIALQTFKEMTVLSGSFEAVG